jgi:signal transduction histidine kinase
MGNVRTSVHALRDQGLDLQAIFEELAASAVGLSVSVDVADDDLPPVVAQGFAMIAREAVSNTQRHSTATSMKLSVRDHPGFHQLTITDNGPGLSADPRHSATGLGLRSMEDRIRVLGGTLRLDWASGFTILATVPKETPNFTTKTS